VNKKALDVRGRVGRKFQTGTQSGRTERIKSKSGANLGEGKGGEIGLSKGTKREMVLHSAV